MKIAICASMAFAKEILEIRSCLKKLGHIIICPKNIRAYLVESQWKVKGLSHGVESAIFKQENDLLRDYYKKIMKSDAILVLNYKKKGIANYIGGNTLIEIAFAHVLKKKIFLLNPIPEIEYYFDEIKAMDPYIIDGDLSKII